MRYRLFDMHCHLDFDADPRALADGLAAVSYTHLDLPHAERQASLLSLDPALLGELLGTADLGELLDPQVVAQVEAQLQRLAPDRRARGVEGAADLLRVLGPLAAEEAAARLEALGGSPGSGLEACDAEAAASAPSRPATPAEACALLEKLRDAKRAFPAMIGGVERWAAVELSLIHI